MIVTEYYRTRNDGVRLFKTHSDLHHYIIQDQTGIKYDEAIDVENRGYTYTESDEIIQDEPDEEPIGEEEQPNSDDVTPEEVMDALDNLFSDDEEMQPKEVLDGLEEIL